MVKKERIAFDASCVFVLTWYLMERRNGESRSVLRYVFFARRRRDERRIVRPTGETVGANDMSVASSKENDISPRG